MPGAKRNPPLPPKQVIMLLLLARDTYEKQSHACLKDAPLAACIMAGASVEAVLTAVTCMLYDDALKTGKAPTYKDGTREGEIKDLLEWTFYDLLNVAQKAKWIPKKLKLDASLDFRPVKTPVLSDSIRQVRNLVHPARYLKDRELNSCSMEELRILYATCHAVHDCLIKAIAEHYPNLRTSKLLRQPAKEASGSYG